MKKFNTQGIVLARANYGEAARIITFLTPDNGKLKVIAKGVRKQNSKLAGGIELFSVSDIGVFTGRGEINTLASSRLLKHYGNIVKDLSRSDIAYQLVKTINKATAENPEAAYFNLLDQAFQALDDKNIDPQLVDVWFGAQLLKLAGHSPDLYTEKSGAKLQPGKSYDFNIDTMAFQLNDTGQIGTGQIKFLRLLFSGNSLKAINKIQSQQDLLAQSGRLVRSMLQAHIRI